MNQRIKLGVLSMLVLFLTAPLGGVAGISRVVSTASPSSVELSVARRARPADNDRFDLSRIAAIKGVQKIYLPKAALSDMTMWNLLQSDNFLSTLSGANDFLLLVTDSKVSAEPVSQTVAALKADEHYKLLFEVDNTADLGYGVAFVRPTKADGDQAVYSEMIFIGRLGFPRQQMVLQVTGQLAQEQIDNFVAGYFNP